MKTALAGTMFAGMAAMIPPNVATDLLTVLAFTCSTCLEADNGGEEIKREKDGGQIRAEIA